MKKIIVLLFISALSLQYLWAQEVAKQSSVQIEDGSQIVGIVTFEDHTIAIFTPYGETVRVPLNRIVKITEYNGSKKTTADPSYDWSHKYTHGLYSNFSYMFFLGAGDDSNGGTGFSAEIGYRFRPELSLGLQLGWSYYGDGSYTLPIKAVVRSEFGKSKIAPVVVLGMGYNVNLGTSDKWYDNDDYKGFIIAPEVGIVIRGAKKVNHSLTMIFQGSQGKYYEYEWAYGTDMYRETESSKLRWAVGLKYSVGI